MPTIIDSLFLELGFDVAKVTKGQNEASSAVKQTSEQFSKHGKEIEKQATLFGEAVGKSTVKLLGLFATMIMGGRAAREFTQYITDSDAALGRSARNIQVSADTLSAWQTVVKESGGKAEDATAGFQSLATNIANMKLGHVSEQFAEGMAQLSRGGKVMDWFGPADQMMLDMSENLHNIAAKEGPAVALQIARMMGQSEAMANALVKGRGATAAQLEIWKKFAPSQEDIERANKFTKGMADLQAAGSNLGRTFSAIFDKLLPNFFEFSQNSATNWANWLTKAFVASVEFGDKVAAGFNTLVDIFSADFTYIHDHWREMLDQMWGLFGEFGNKIGESGSFILSMFQQAFSSVFLWLKKSFNEIWGAVFGHPLFGDAGATGGAIVEGLGYGATPKSTGGGGSGREPSNRSTSSGSSRGGGSPGSPGWWTPERQQHAYEKLKAAGLSDMGAKGLVSRWAFVESSGGPAAVNPTSGAFGIGQWLGSRKPGIAGNTDFDAQLDYVVKELNSSEKRAAGLLRNAKTPEEAARAATAYERAEGWNSATNTDRWTGKTQAGIGRVHTGGAAPAPSSGLAQGRTPGQTDPHKPGFDPSAVKFHDYFPKSGVSPSSSNATTNNTSNQAHITINSSSGNPHEIAKAVKDSLDRTSYAMHGNYSLA